MGNNKNAILYFEANIQDKIIECACEGKFKVEIQDVQKIEEKGFLSDLTELCRLLGYSTKIADMLLEISWEHIQIRKEKHEGKFINANETMILSEAYQVGKKINYL